MRFEEHECEEVEKKKTFFEYNMFETNLKSKKNNNTYVNDIIFGNSKY